MKAVCRTLVVACAAVVGLPCAGAAQYVAIAPPQHAIYPAGGQSAEQQQTDMTECQAWATQQSGVDLNRLPPPPSGEVPEGGVVRGGARGALVGVTAGAIAGDAGTGAAVGAATGALVGGMRRRDQAAQQQNEQQQWEQQVSQQIATWDRQFVACMSGRGYSVN